MAASDADAVTGQNGDDAAEGAAATSASAGDGAGLSAAAREWVRRTVAELGPLTDDDRDYLAFMFHRRS